MFRGESAEQSRHTLTHAQISADLLRGTAACLVRPCRTHIFGNVKLGGLICPDMPNLQTAVYFAL